MKKDQVIEITQFEALQAVEALAREEIHCLMRFIGADWDKEDVIKLIKDSKRIAWADHPLNHNLAIINNGILHSFDLRFEDYIRWLATPEDEVVITDLEEEVKMLREQYLEIEEKAKELGKTTKRVQTFVSKLSSKDNG